MPLEINTTTGANLPQFVALQCVRLCKPDSEMSSMFSRLSAGDGAVDEDLETLVAWCSAPSLTDEFRDVVGWATVQGWNGQLALQSFVDPEWRHKSVCFSMSACLLADLPTSSLPVAVFSDECASVVRRLQHDYQQWKRVDDGWIRTCVPEGGDS